MRKLSLVLVLGLGVPGLTANAAPWTPPASNVQISIWPGAAPGGQVVDGPEDSEDGGSQVAGKPWTAVFNVTRPTITVFSPRGKNSGAAVVVFPGGGYQVLAIDLEGTEICDWLTSRGITCVLLKYRVPHGMSNRSGPYPKSTAALQDAQRTMGLLRRSSSKWKIDPKKIGVIGFSAGGHLVAAISTNFKTRLYPAVDDADNESCRPNFAISLYPGHIPKDYKPDLGISPYLPVSSETPPTLLIHAQDDPVDPVEYSLVYYAALKKNNVPVEMHLYAEGKHAFGLRRTNLPITSWPELAEKWLGSIGMIAK